jgi:hypothetical protein
MSSNVAASHLVGDALIAERAEKPIKDSRCVALGNCVQDPGRLHINANIIKKCQRSRQAADPSDQINGAIILLGYIVEGRAGLTSRRLLRQLVSRDQSQIRDTNLRCASLSPSMYLCVV